MMKAEVTEAERQSLDSMTDVACGVQPLQFKKVTDYTTFLVEYAWDGDDVVFHFFRTPEKDTKYWMQVFPAVLDPVAREVFQAGPSRLKAAYTEEMDSWWLRANNYGDLLDKDAFIASFLKKLDQVLDTTISA